MWAITSKNCTGWELWKFGRVVAYATSLEALEAAARLLTPPSITSMLSPDVHRLILDVHLPNASRYLV